MAQPRHSSISRHRRHLQPPPIPDWPSEHNLFVATNTEVHVRSAERIVTNLSHNSCTADDITSCSANRTSHDKLRILLGHGSTILYADYCSEQETRYHLKGAQTQIARVLFFPDSRYFIFWTKHSNTIRGYSTISNAFTEFSCTHPSEPICAAISATSQYIVSSSRKPGTVYLQDSRWPKTQIPVRFTNRSAQNSDALPQPGAYVVVTAFHPEKKGIFLLAHSDGTISIHNASRICKSKAKGMTSNGMKRIVGHVHHKPIVAAEFLACYKMRTISLGKNGKCRVVDFEHGINTIVAWEVGMECTSLTVLSPEEVSYVEKVSDSSSDKELTMPSFDAPVDMAIINHYVAIGAKNGSVSVYSTAGLIKSRTRPTGHVIKGLCWLPEVATPTLPWRDGRARDVMIDWPPVDAPEESNHPVRVERQKPAKERLPDLPQLPPSRKVQRTSPIRCGNVPNTRLKARDRPQQAFMVPDNGASSQRPEEAVVQPRDDIAESGTTEPSQPPRTPVRRPSKISLLDSLRRRRELAQNNLTPPRKNLNEEAPGTVPRDARYVPIKALFSPTLSAKAPEAHQVDQPSAAHQDSYHHDQELPPPTDFERHLLGGSMLTSKHHQKARHPDDVFTDDKPKRARSDVRELSVSQIRPQEPTSGYERYFMTGALDDLSQQDEDGKSSLSPAPAVSLRDLDLYHRPLLFSRPTGPLRAQRVSQTMSVPHRRPVRSQSPALSTQPLLQPTPLKEPLRGTKHSPVPRPISRKHSQRSRRHFHVPGHFVDSDDDTIEDVIGAYEDLVTSPSPYQHHHPPEHHHHDPGSTSLESDLGELKFVRGCNCTCADVVREEMALVRGEIGSLRKMIWVVGTGVENRKSTGTAGDWGAWFNREERMHDEASEARQPREGSAVRPGESSGSHYRPPRQ